MNIKILKNKLLERFKVVKGFYPEFKVNCGFCNDKRFRFCFNLKKKVSHCFNCGKILKDVKLLEHLKLTDLQIPDSIEDVESFLESTMRDFQTSFSADFTSNLHVINDDFFLLYDVLDDSTFDKETLEYALRARDYLHKRGFRDDTYNRRFQFSIASIHSRLRNRLIIPVFENGLFVYYQARALGSEEPKYLNPTKSDTLLGKSEFIFNLDAVDKEKEVYICEGIFSAISAGPQAVAILGKDLSDIQQHKLISSGVNKVLILLDPGEQFSSMRIANKLVGKIESVRVAELKNGDPNEITLSELSQVIENAKEIPAFDFSRF